MICLEYTQTEIVRVAMDDLESESEISESDEDGEECSNLGVEKVAFKLEEENEEIMEDEKRMGIVEVDNQRENEKDKIKGFRCKEDEKILNELEYSKNHKENKMEDVENKMENVVDNKMEKLEDEMENMEDKMENMEEKMENIEDKMENIEDERIETDEGLDLQYEDYPSDSSSISGK